MGLIISNDPVGLDFCRDVHRPPPLLPSLHVHCQWGAVGVGHQRRNGSFPLFSSPFLLQVDQSSCSGTGALLVFRGLEALSDVYGKRDRVMVLSFLVCPFGRYVGGVE